MIIEVGKLGSFHSNLLLGRPYHYTYELLERRPDESYSRLRIVPPSELNAEIVAEDVTPSESRGDPATPNGNGMLEAYDLLTTNGSTMKTNQLTIDDASRQSLTQVEIEELKKSAGGKEIIEKILANHSGLDEKTIFSKAKYLLRKRSKYLKRFTVLPMDLGNLIEYVFEKEPSRIMEMREEALGLITAWSNVHVTISDGINARKDENTIGGGRWLVADDTGGLVVAALAERLGILHKPSDYSQETSSIYIRPLDSPNGNKTSGDEDAKGNPDSTEVNGQAAATPSSERSHRDFPTPALTNTITLIHAAAQPNISLLKYFGYDANQPDPDHPLHSHLKPLSWLQLLEPQDDPIYREPEYVTDAELANWKSGKRGTYWKKRRRWERCQRIVHEARAGGFDGLVIASSMDPISILPHTIPLVRGGGHVVLYSPTIAPLEKVMDLYSKERRTAYIQQQQQHELSKGNTPDPVDFPVDPRLLLAPTLQTSRVRTWQVLPGRTHPLMTDRGGSEGYVFTARRVIPVEGGVAARGNFSGKKRRADGAVVDASDAGATSSPSRVG